MNDVEALATARYGPPDRLKTSKKTAQWHTPDHGRLLVNRLEGYFRFDDGTKGFGPQQWLVRVEGVGRAQAAERFPLANSSSPLAPLPTQDRTEPDTDTYTPQKRWDAAWPAVRRYLTAERRLPASLVDTLYRAGRLYATGYGSIPYVVFPLVNADGQNVGAIVRCAGTPDQQQAQEQAGYALKRVVKASDVSHAWWSPGLESERPRYQLVLVEAPLDAIALAARFTAKAGRYPGDVVIRACGGSALNAEFHTAGGPWTRVVAGFDNDREGNEQAQKVMDWVTSHTPDTPVTRAKPDGKDWAEDWAGAATEQDKLPNPFAERQKSSGLDR